MYISWKLWGKRELNVLCHGGALWLTHMVHSITQDHTCWLLWGKYMACQRYSPKVLAYLSRSTFVLAVFVQTLWSGNRRWDRYHGLSSLSWDFQAQPQTARGQRIAVVSLESVFLSQIALASLFCWYFLTPHGHNEIRSWMYVGPASLFSPTPLFYPNEQRQTANVHLLASLSLHMVNRTSIGPMNGFLSCLNIWMRGTKERQGRTLWR